MADKVEAAFHPLDRTRVLMCSCDGCPRLVTQMCETRFCGARCRRGKCDHARPATCCTCDPAACAATVSGEHCVNSNCAYCLHGCPAAIDAQCCGAWKREGR